MTNEDRVLEVQKGLFVKENMERLFIDNRNFIVMIILRTLRKRDIPEDMLEDFIQSSYFALVKAVNDFDVSRGYKFLSYFPFHIKNQLLRKDLPQSKLFNTKEKSLDEEVINYDGDNTTLLETLEDKDAISVEEQAEKNVLAIKLWQAVDEALPDELLRNTMIQRYKYDRTRKAIAEEQAISIEDVINIESRAKLRLRKNKYIKNLRDRNWHSLAYRNVGIRTFDSTWTSSTELAAFRKMKIDLEADLKETRKQLKELDLFNIW